MRRFYGKTHKVIVHFSFLHHHHTAHLSHSSCFYVFPLKSQTMISSIKFFPNEKESWRQKIVFRKRIKRGGRVREDGNRPLDILLCCYSTTRNYVLRLFLLLLSWCGRTLHTQEDKYTSRFALRGGRGWKLGVMGKIKKCCNYFNIKRLNTRGHSLFTN